MTQKTLTKERREKFEEILSAFSDKLTQAEIEATAELLVTASLSRSERKTDETKGDYITAADRKVDAILAQSIKPEGYWQGRENIPPHLLKYADWWNKRTGQEMKGKVKADYLKEWTAWNNDELPLSALDEAFEYVNGWKSRQGGRVAHPREITKDAVGFAAHPKQEETKPITGGFYG